MRADGNGHSTEERPQRAFVIEDDALTLRLISELASGAGLEPFAFTRLSTARRALNEQMPDVLVVDDDLPDGQGADLIRELRADPRTRDVRVLFCTAANPDRRREIAELADVIAKPFRLAEVEQALAEVAAG